MAHNGNNVDMNGNAMYSAGSRPSENNNNNNNNMVLKKGPWTAVEDRILMEYVNKHGEGNWNAVQRNSGLKRCGKSCRLRWANHLRPNLKKGQITPDEERLILDLHAKYGNKWARMASHLPGRTDNEIKNYWNTRVKKRLRKGLPLYPHDINPSNKRVCHSYDNTMSIPPGLKQLVTASTMPQTDDTNFSFLYQNHIPQLPPRPSHNHEHNSSATLNHYHHNTSMPSFDFHHPAHQMLATPLGYKRYQEDIGISPPISPTRQRNSSMLRTSSMPEFATGTMTSDISSFQFQPQTMNDSFLPLCRSNNHFNFGDVNLSSSPSRRSDYSMNLERSSRQVSYKPDPSSSQAQSTLSEITTSSTHANVVNATHSSDGFLEQLLLEADRFGYGSHPIRKQIGSQSLNSSDHHERSHAFGGYGHSLPSTAIDSSLLEMKATQDNYEQMNSIPKYLAKLLSFNSSTEMVANSNEGQSTVTAQPNSSLLEMKPTQDHDEQMNSMPKYLAKLFSFNLSTEEVPNSYNGENTKQPNSHQPEGGLEFDVQHHMDSLFPAANSWDNLAETSVEVS